MLENDMQYLVIMQDNKGKLPVVMEESVYRYIRIKIPNFVPFCSVLNLCLAILSFCKCNSKPFFQVQWIPATEVYSSFSLQLEMKVLCKYSQKAPQNLLCE